MPLPRLPAVKVSTVYHVGSLHKPPVRKGDSLEGPCLSVSTCPEEWAAIARLPGDIWTLRAPPGAPGRFVDVLAIPKSVQRLLDERILKDGLVKEVTAYRVERYDSEMEETCYMTFPTLKEAQEEAGEVEDGGSPPVAITAFAATPALKAHLESQGFPVKRSILEAGETVREFAWMKILEEETDFDGFWWKETIDPDNYSAPRGAIFQSRLARWERTCPAIFQKARRSR